MCTEFADSQTGTFFFMLTRALLTIFLLQLFSLCQAQQTETDSLERIIKTIPSDTSKVWNLNKLVYILREQDSQKALQYGREARDLATLLNYEHGLGQALENLGWIHYRRGDYARAFELSVEAMAISEKVKDYALMARCLNNIAAVNSEQNQYDLAISNFKKAYAVSKSVGDGFSMARSLNNVGFCFFKTDQLDSARNYALWGMRTAKNVGSQYTVGFSLRTLGDIEMKERNYDAALENFENVMIIAGEINNIFLQVSTLHRLGKAYVALGKLDKAIGYLNRNIAITRRHNFLSELEMSLKLISEIYEMKNDIARAYAYQTQYLDVHDSLYQQRSSEQMALMQVKFDSEMKEAKIEILTKDAELKQEQINNQQIWVYFSIGVISLMAILAFVLLYNNRRKKKANDELAIKNSEIQQQAQQLHNVNITKDKLFSVISHDLRSPLASLKGLMDIVAIDGLSREDFIAMSRKIGRNLESVQDDLDNLLFWAQSQLQGLQSHQTSLKVLPIIDEKIRLFGELARQKEITILNEVDDSLSILADKNHVGLAVRNLLANAIKFTKQGGLIMIREKSVGDYVEISITDTGVGMTAIEVEKLFKVNTHFTKPGTHQEKGLGIGLLLTKEFIERNGGSIWATSEPGIGSTFTFTLKHDYTPAGIPVD